MENRNMQEKANQSNSGTVRNMLLSTSGTVAVVVGLIGSSFGSAWSPQVYEFLFNIEIVEFIDTFMPYFPLVPFYPIFMIMLGSFLIVKSKK
jgi:hypothetical protein